MILPQEQWSTRHHLGEDASRAPNVDFLVVPSPCEHDLGCTVVSGRDVACHLQFLHAGQAKVADSEIAVFVDEDVAWFEVAMDDTG